MPKQIATMSDFSGGLNDSTDKRDLAPNEFAECTNLDPHKKGKLILAPVFVAGATADRGGVIDGYGMFTFSNDYNMAGLDGYTGYFVALAESGNIDIYQSSDTTWYDNRLIGIPSGTPAFMSAEGDLFVSGDHSATPASFVYKKRTDFNLVTGVDSDIDRDVAAWSAENQSKASPDADDMQMWWSNVASSGTLDVDSMANASTDGIATDEIIWVAEWDGATTGSWSNTGDASEGRHIQFSASWLYKNQAESDLYVLNSGVTPDYDGVDLDNTTKNYPII